MPRKLKIEEMFLELWRVKWACGCSGGNWAEEAMKGYTQVISLTPKVGLRKRSKSQSNGDHDSPHRGEVLIMIAFL